MGKVIIIRILPIILALLVIFNSGLVFAQSPTGSTTGIQEVESSRLTGQIIKVENETITINTRDGVKQVNVPGDINITKNGNSVAVVDLQPGDGVIVTRSANGEVLSVDALSGSALDVTKWILPVGLGLLVLALLAFFAWGRMKKDYIKTTGKS